MDNFFILIKTGVAKYPAFLDDYAFLTQAMHHLQEITTDEKYLYKAKELTEHVIDNFQIRKAEFFFYTTKGKQDIIARKIEFMTVQRLREFGYGR